MTLQLVLQAVPTMQQGEQKERDKAADGIYMLISRNVQQLAAFPTLHNKWKRGRFLKCFLADDPKKPGKRQFKMLQGQDMRDLMRLMAVILAQPKVFEADPARGQQLMDTIC